MRLTVMKNTTGIRKKTDECKKSLPGLVLQTLQGFSVQNM